MNVDLPEREALSKAAWAVRGLARVHGPTRVGCAALSADGRIFVGCNLEHRFRSHDIHAEVNAISSLVAGTTSGLVAVLIAAERERFTPCGSCLDWIFEIGGGDCIVLSEKAMNGDTKAYLAKELMPWYPT